MGTSQSDQVIYQLIDAPMTRIEVDVNAYLLVDNDRQIACVTSAGILSHSCRGQMRMSFHRHMFDTSAGFAAIGWRDTGVVSFRLPAPTARDAERALLRRLPASVAAEPPARIREVIDAARRYFVGERVSFASVRVDLGNQDPLFERIIASWGASVGRGRQSMER
jgi:hypothetical protein